MLNTKEELQRVRSGRGLVLRLPCGRGNGVAMRCERCYKRRVRTCRRAAQTLGPPAFMDLVSTPKNPIPLGASTGFIEVRKGLRLRFASWQSVLRERRGTVCIFPGRAEFIEKYFEVVGELRRRGFAVAVLDWRGQGGSSRLTRNPLKGHVNDFAEYEEDLVALHESRGAAGLSRALLRARPLDGVHGAVQRGDQARLLVHAHGLDRADGEDRRICRCRIASAASSPTG